MARIGVVGCGSIGRVLARGFDELGHRLLLNDQDPSQTDDLPYPAVDKPTLANQAEAIIVAVPTPTTAAGGDAHHVEAVLEEIAMTDATICLRSTMPPGSTRRLADAYGLPLVYSPEFLKDRSGVDDFFSPDRIVLAGPPDERAVIRGLLDDDQINCSQFIETARYTNAELAKEAHNAFFATKVSFANQMRAIAEAAGADPQWIMDVVTADHRNTSSHLDPMLGPYGGKCLPKDTEALRLYARRDLGAPTAVLDGTVSMNDIAKEEYDNRTITGQWPNVSASGD